MKVIFMRHGESQNNALKSNSPETIELFEKQRQHDPTLSEKGYKESHQAGRLLKQHNYKIDAFFTSGFKRAIETADMVRKGY